ncbi:MAG: glycosyltransferase family 39 protein, partial [Anaerolineales bacterium]
MWSDQAEKLLDVRDVLNGDHKIFFARNSGREAIEFYWAVLFGKLFGTGLSFMTLKLVTTVAGFLAMPFLYLFGREIGGRRVGLLGMLLAGFAFWPNITSRAGLRMPLNELFVAAALFYLLRGLRRGTRNDFLWSGLAVGLGLQGYSGARVLPLAVLVAMVLYLLYERAGTRRMRVMVGFSGLVLVSIIGFLPLFRVLIDTPDQVLYRTLTRIGTVEQPYPDPPVLVFLRNTWDILKMFSWDNGQIWIETVPHRPALDWVTGAFFHLGIVAAAIGAWRRRRWDLLFLVVSIPIFLLPSSLALAFPNENPAPNRVTGAIVPVFTLAAVMMDATYTWARRRLDRGRWRFSLVLVMGLLATAAAVNYRLVFDTYAKQERASAWNATEAGKVMRGFDQSVGDYEHVFLVYYPFWMDSRLVAIEAGAPIRDYSIQPEDVGSQQLDPAAYSLFLLKPEDVGSMTLLDSLYSRGTLTLYRSAVPDRDFFLFLVPPEIEATPGDPATGSP